MLYKFYILLHKKRNESSAKLNEIPQRICFLQENLNSNPISATMKASCTPSRLPARSQG